MKRATPVNSASEIAQVATVSSRDPEVGEMVAGAMDKVGKDGVVTVEESQSIESSVDVTEGISFDKGYLSPYFATEEETYNAVLDDAAILLVRNKISSLPDFLPLLEKIAESSRPTLIIAEDVEGEPLQALVVNSIRKVLKVAAVKAPYFGERRKGFMDDLAVVTGATVVDPEVGINLNEVGLEVLGSARRVTVSRKTPSSSTVLAPLRQCRSVASSCAAKSSAPIPPGTVRSSRSVWLSCPAAWPSSASALLPRPRSTSASCASRMPSTLPARPSMRASSQAAVPHSCRSPRNWKSLPRSSRARPRPVCSPYPAR